MSIEVKGKAGIVAKILCDSINEQGNRLTTFELEYPRLILSELNTHGMLCKNSASSRAIPFAKMQEQLTGRPVRFGQANPGMQDRGLDYDAPIVSVSRISINGEDQSEELYKYTAMEWWEESKRIAIYRADLAYKSGYHKQVYNRLTEPFQMMRTVLSATELDNFFWLRDHEAADPSLAELARCMREAREQSVPQLLKPGQWHLPYLHQDFFDIGQGVQQFFYLNKTDHISSYLKPEEAIKVSAARCAAVSFRNEDYGLEKCLGVYERLVGADRKHASALQHQASPMKASEIHKSITGCVNLTNYPETWQPGISHADREGNLWSAQYKGFVMYRKLIPGENYTPSAV